MKMALFVGVAGAVGAICRIAFGEMLAVSIAFPIATLTVNLIGTLVLCVLSAGAIRKLTSNSQVQTAIMTGFLGSFTTFSAFSFETVNLFQHGQFVIASLYVVASVFGGIAIGMLGMKIGRKSVEA